ncbi:hypothetical protein RAH17_16880 [Klebsiella pneumoniae]|mgnify:CR=1 FL=1|jgi:hypothetical protein|uniref:hypothetical protein n=1 Tax=Klebsiella pneumoniae TaxID=573 RepID=UPI00050CDCC2|nr:hypothetical protein [Klebsiella pneumoniae]HDS3975621.1 hypothetical protein [Klebsiella pneumoniae subsp. pneumoniae]HDS3990777.1 hypothetical protein [Klebsiella pneumoniae subsp. ozaenae]EKU4310070.1 hypothetical protein [Klebsiella pneumoniae]EKV0197454.1 hypothetical protein [Klebsiella pneumoniae]EKV6232168.1 hypothetical protein [Klebsiella pneumoniae]
MHNDGYEHIHRLDRQEFIAWYEEVVRVARENKSNVDLSYKGFWVDFFDDGLTPEQAIEQKIKVG